MAALQYYLAQKALKWAADNSARFTSDGELELHNLLDLAEIRAASRSNFAGGVVPQGSSDLAEVENNLERLLEKAKANTGGAAIDAMTLQRARLSLCPIFPFC